MLDDVAVWPLAENPARKDAAPCVVALILHGQLNERAGFGRVFPRRGRLACPQAHDRAPDPRRFARLHLEVADQPVAFVEQADDRDPLGHRSRAFDPADLLRHPFRFGDRRHRRAAIALGRGPIAARQRGCREQRDQRGRNPARHYSPGRQAS
jgi:hypothetical protein